MVEWDGKLRDRSWDDDCFFLEDKVINGPFWWEDDDGWWWDEEMVVDDDKGWLEREEVEVCLFNVWWYNCVCSSIKILSSSSPLFIFNIIFTIQKLVFYLLISSLSINHKINNLSTSSSSSELISKVSSSSSFWPLPFPHKLDMYDLGRLVTLLFVGGEWDEEEEEDEVWIWSNGRFWLEDRNLAKSAISSVDVFFSSTVNFNFNLDCGPRNSLLSFDFEGFTNLNFRVLPTEVYEKIAIKN